MEASLEIDAPAERVWRVVSDPRNLPRWDRHVLSVEGVPPDGLRPGSTYTTTMRHMGARTRVFAEVIEFRPEEYSKVRLEGLLRGVVETWVEPLDGARARLRQRVDYRFRGGPLARLASRAVQRLGVEAQLKAGMAEQKRQAERGG